MKNTNYYYNEKEKKIAADICVSVWEDLYDAGQLTAGVIISNGEIIGREDNGEA